MRDRRLPGLDHGDTHNCVFWGPALEKLKGNKVRLRFELREAKVYSFGFDD